MKKAQYIVEENDNDAFFRKRMTENSTKKMKKRKRDTFSRAALIETHNNLKYKKGL